VSGQTSRREPVTVSDATDEGEHARVVNGRLWVDVISGGTGGIQYTEGDTDASITGTAILWEDVGDALVPVSAVTPLPVNIISGGSGGTQYAEDTAHVSGDLVTLAGVVQQAADAALSSDGDRSILQVDGSGFLKVNVKTGGGGGVQYTQGDVDATPTGTVAMGKNASLDEILAIQVAADGRVMVDIDSPVQVSPIWTENGVDGGAGATTGATQRVVLATNDLAVLSLSVIDDWDESDRAKVNTIVGQAGVQGASGIVSANTQRVVLATDVALPAGTNSIGIVDTELPVAAVLGDADPNPTAPQVGAALQAWNGGAWYRAGGSAANGLEVDITRLPNEGQQTMANSISVAIASNQSAIAVTADTELPAAGALADNDPNPTTSRIGANQLLWDGATWDRSPGNSTDGTLVNLGTNNDVTVTGSVTADTELPAAVALTADNVASPTAPAVGAFGHYYDGTNWDRVLGSTTDGMLVNLGANNDVIQATASNLNAQIVGELAHDAADSGNPLKLGMKAIANGASPSAVAANDRTNWYASRHGIPWVLGGHPNIITREVTILDSDGAQTNASLLGTIAAGTSVVITMIDVMASGANTVDVKVRIGFGTASVPAASLTGVNGVVLSHSKVKPGSGVVKGDGSGVIAQGASDEELRITCDDPVGGAITVTITYHTIEI
jgi:hypothetical protein